MRTNWRGFISVRDWLCPRADWLYPHADWLYTHADWLHWCADCLHRRADYLHRHLDEPSPHRFLIASRERENHKNQCNSMFYVDILNYPFKLILTCYHRPNVSWALPFREEVTSNWKDNNKHVCNVSKTVVHQYLSKLDTVESCHISDNSDNSESSESR